MSITMTLGAIATKARSLTHSDTVSYTAANLLVDINIWYEKVVSMIFESQDDTDFDDQRSTDYPIVTTPFVLNGTDNLYSMRDYAMPVSERVLKIKRVDITYDGTNWFRANPFDDGVTQQAIYGGTDATPLLAVDNNFIKQSPRYDVKYNSLFIYPRASASDIASGAKIQVEWERDIVVFTTADYSTDPSDSTAIPGFDNQFHAMVAYGAAYEFANANNLPQLQNIKSDLRDWEGRLRTAYGRKDLDTMLALRPAYDSYGDYGSTGAGGYFYGR